jgi:hypothetical protein
MLQAEQAHSQTTELGPLLLRVKPKTNVTTCLLAAALLGGGVAVFAMLTDGWLLLALLAGSAAIGAAFLGAGLRDLLATWGRVFFVHAGGIRDVQGGRETVVPFAAVDEVTFRMTRMFQNERYFGTFQEMVLRAGGRTYPFDQVIREQTGMTTDYQQTTPMQTVCDRASALIAARMDEQLRRGEAVAWTGSLRLDPAGVEVVGRGTLIEWERIARVDIENGVCRLWVEGSSRPQVEIDTKATNFFPGHAVVAARLRQSAPCAEPAARDEAPVVTGEQSVTLTYTNTVADHVALRCYIIRTEPAKRNEWLARVLGIPACLAGIGLIVAVYTYGQNAGYALAALGLFFGFAVFMMPVLHFTMIDRKNLARELEAAHRLAEQCGGPDPFQSFRVTLAPQGFVVNTPASERSYHWREVARVARFRGNLFVFLAGDKVSRDRLALIIPSRALGDEEHARQTVARIREWHSHPHIR